MIKIQLDSGEEVKLDMTREQEIAYERFIRFMAKMICKYGEEILKELEEEKEVITCDDSSEC